MKMQTKPSTGQEFLLELLRCRLAGEKIICYNYGQSIWKEAISIGINHRVALLIYNYVKTNNISVPNNIFQNLKVLYHANTINKIKFERELSTLNRIFYTHNISLLSLKGFILSQFLYNDASLRPSVDIDILVHPDDLPLAILLLKERGYIETFSGRRAKLWAYRLNTHHWPFRHPERRINLELHHKLIPNSRSAVIDSDKIWDHTITISYEDMSLEVFGREDLLLYLAMHNAMESWHSLLQTNDIAAVIANNTDLDWEFLLKRAESWHCKRRLLISCGITAELLKISLPYKIVSMINEEWNVKTIISHFISELMSTLSPHNQTKLSSISQTYFDLIVADRNFDRFSLLAYKFNNRVVKLLSF